MAPSTKPAAKTTEKATAKTTKGGRDVPHHSEKASKYYPVEEDAKPKTVRKSIRPTKLRSSLKPGTVLILLAGRFRGKRVVLINQLDQGVLLVTGPFKVNGVPIRRVNARYVIATSTRISIGDIDKDALKKVSDESYFAREKSSKGKGEEAFFKQGEKPEKKELGKGRAENQKSIDKSILAAIRKEPLLASYMASSFSLRKNDRPHTMTF